MLVVLILRDGGPTQVDGHSAQIFQQNAVGTVSIVGIEDELHEG